ncbi:hypothetical protein [Alcaligenes aquatilis]|uniref:Uncharacterized protein n=1 Tax=Alcaligenes aquatilis TaxID=323284 RepID=A0A3G2HQX5_9BURK|nr:hypothetical protein [Alcaligenes aquatilis]AYN19526.1 hypothetical protein D3M96_02630 [Alcaligenes aquatilis]
MRFLGSLQRHAHQVWLRGWRVLIGGVMGVGVSGPLQAEPVSVPTDHAPQSWLAYADMVRSGIENALIADEDLMQRLRGLTLDAAVAKVWVERGGKLSAVELDDQTNSSIEREFRKRLVGLHFDKPPPALRWPIILRLDWSEALRHDDEMAPTAESEMMP